MKIPATIALLLSTLLLSACESGVTYYAGPSAEVWTVSPAVLEVYPLEAFQRATDIWCAGSDARWCPVFEAAPTGEVARIVLDDNTCAPQHSACFYGMQVHVRSVDLGDCIGVVIAHELAHAVRLRFDGEHHSTEGLLAPETTDMNLCSADWQLDPVTVKAFNDLTWAR
jgi:hypothetical protein